MKLEIETQRTILRLINEEYLDQVAGLKCLSKIYSLLELICQLLTLKKQGYLI